MEADVNIKLPKSRVRLVRVMAGKVFQTFTVWFNFVDIQGGLSFVPAAPEQMRTITATDVK